MTALNTFQFSQKYTLRPAGKEAHDYKLAEQWTEADPDHHGRVQPQFWLEQGEGKDSFLFLDDQGPLFFFKMILFDRHTVEIHIQFAPHPSPRKLKKQRTRTAQGLIEGLAWLEKILRQAEIQEMFFDSVSPSLILFAIKRLGFQLEGGKLRKRL